MVNNLWKIMELCPEYMLVPPSVKLDIYDLYGKRKRLDAELIDKLPGPFPRYLMVVAKKESTHLRFYPALKSLYDDLPRSTYSYSWFLGAWDIVEMEKLSIAKLVFTFGVGYAKKNQKENRD